MTVLSADVDRETTPGLHYIWAEDVYASMLNGTFEFDLASEIGKSPFESLAGWYGFYPWSCSGYQRSKGFQTLFNYPDDFKFDLVLVDFVMEPCLIGFLDKFNYPPTVGLSAFGVPPYTYEFIGGYSLPSYVSHSHAHFGFKMNFYERIVNFLVYVYEDYQRRYVLYPAAEASMKAAFKNPNLPSPSELLKKISLVLANTHFAIEKIEPLPPNVIPVGGLQIQEPQPLEKDLEDFVQSGKKGVVLFSLGTIMKSEYMKDEDKRKFVEAFSQLPDYNFIWKYESDLKIDLPANVKTLGWVRQNDILAHPRTKAFISHCGLLGTQEAAWYGIPVVGVPFMADQHKVCRR